MKSLLKCAAATLVVILLTAAAGIGGVYMFEIYVASTDPDAKDFWWQYPREPIPISPAVVVNISTSPTLNFPSMHENLDYKGTSPWETRGRVEESRPFHIRSNRFGFYTDYPVNAFPPKQKKEFRIVLVGGSGAQGHGGSTNERMVYHLLQKKLQKSLVDTGYTIRIINLALAGHEARTNSGVLLAFGHKLKPDMILAYNGANDISQMPNNMEADTCLPHYKTLLELTFIQPAWVKTLGEHFPGLFYRYGLANYIKRTFYTEEYKKRAYKTCLDDLGVDTTRGRLKTAIYRDVTAPMFVDHMQTIKRDFCGIPIMIAWQAVQDGERTLYDRWLSDFDPQLNPVAILEAVDTQGAVTRFYNPENRVVHFIIKNHDAPKPTWEEVIHSGEGFSQAEGVVTIPNHSASLPVVYYAMETTTIDQTKEVYMLYKEPELYKFRRKKGTYQQFYERSKAALDGYMNRYWYFLNVDKIASEIDPNTVPDIKFNSIAVHLDDVGQEVVAGILHDNLQPIVYRLIRDPDKASCPER